MLFTIHNHPGKHVTNTVENRTTYRKKIIIITEKTITPCFNLPEKIEKKNKKQKKNKKNNNKKQTPNVPKVLCQGSQSCYSLRLSMLVIMYIFVTRIRKHSRMKSEENTFTVLYYLSALLKHI